jgi:hypothetical protein
MFICWDYTDKCHEMEAFVNTVRDRRIPWKQGIYDQLNYRTASFSMKTLFRGTG